MRNIIIAMLALSLCGCAATANNCAGWEPINPSHKDKLTEGTKKQIIAHDEFGEKQGCWK